MRMSQCVFSAGRTDSNGIEKVFGFLCVGKDVTFGERRSRMAKKNGRSGLTRACLNLTRKTRWLPLLFFVLLNYRNRPANTRQQPIHISSWLKDTRAAHILMRRSRGNFVLVRF